MKNGHREKEGVEPRNREELLQQSGQMLEDGVGAGMANRCTWWSVRGEWREESRMTPHRRSESSVSAGVNSPTPERKLQARQGESYQLRPTLE